MKLFTLLFLMVTVFGCQLFGGKKITSEWISLDSADSIDCSSWPLGEKDLDITEIKVLRGEKTGLIATGRARTGAPVHYYAAFEGDVDLSYNDLRKLPLGRGALVAGGGLFAGSNLAAVIKNSSTKSTLEFRKLKDNVVKHKGNISSDTVSEAFISIADQNAWLTLQQDSGKYRIALANLPKGKAKIELIKNTIYSSQPILLSNPRTKEILAVSKGDDKTAFGLHLLKENGKASSKNELQVPVSESIESWTAYSHGQENYLAYVDGDSLVGQATLRVVSFSWNDGMPKLIWKREIALLDVHVSEPVIVADESSAYVLLQQWVDEESTIASYKIGLAKLHAAEFKGIFPKGTRIIDAFAYGKSKDPFAILRYRKDTSWKFEICELD